MIATSGRPREHTPPASHDCFIWSPIQHGPADLRRRWPIAATARPLLNVIGQLLWLWLHCLPSTRNIRRPLPAGHRGQQTLSFIARLAQSPRHSQLHRFVRRAPSRHNLRPITARFCGGFSQIRLSGNIPGSVPTGRPDHRSDRHVRPWITIVRAFHAVHAPPPRPVPCCRNHQQYAIDHQQFIRDAPERIESRCRRAPSSRVVSQRFRATVGDMDARFTPHSTGANRLATV